VFRVVLCRCADKFGLLAFVALFFVFLFEFAADDACAPLAIYFGSGQGRAMFNPK
jgi:hypothetical protein